MTNEEFLVSLGFTEIKEPFFDKTIYEKDLRFCHSNCIGCEYCMLARIIRYNKSTKYVLELYLYKPCTHDSEMNQSGGYLHFPKDAPSCKIVLINVERKSLKEILADCIITVSKTMTAMDLCQIAGMDFFDLSNSSRSDIVVDGSLEEVRICKLYDANVK